MFGSFVLRLTALAFLFGLLISPAPAFAYNPLGSIDCNNSRNREAAVCQSAGGDPITGPDGIIRKATNILAVIAGVGAVIVIVLSGIRYITSAGDANQISQAKRTIIFALVGLVVIIVAQSVINFIILRI